VLLVDASTDRAHLDAQLAAAGATSATVELLNADRRDVDAAFTALLRAAG